MQNKIWIGNMGEFSNKLRRQTKTSLKKILNTASVIRPESIASFIESFLKKFQKYEGLVIWYKPKYGYTTYALVIDKKEKESVRMLIDYRVPILTGTINGRNEVSIISEKTTGEGLAIIKRLFEEMLENENVELLKP